MRLFIAEKPSLARAIAAALPEPRVQRKGSIACGPSDVVAWCAGHILEHAEPEQYDPAFKTWRLDHLPIVPAKWKLVPKAPDLLANIKELLGHADQVVHAGDPDREGQRLVDAVLQYLAYKGPVQRLLVNDLNLPAVKTALGVMESNEKFQPLSASALARSQADWLIGMNLTRLYTLLCRAGGGDTLLSVGRVQTPVLGLVVRRDLEIEAFTPKPFFVVRASIDSTTGSFAAIWKPDTANAAWFDSSDRLTDAAAAADVVRRVSGAKATVTVAKFDKKTEAAPLPYSLSELQVDASRVLGLSAKATLDLCQSLYETHKLLTYPRSNCSHLPAGHHSQAPSVVTALTANAPHLSALAGGADTAVRSRAWDDSKITAHHGIIPTPSTVPAATLSDDERAIYDLVARRYLAQFYPDHLFNVGRLELDVAGEVFVATGRQTLRPGWRATLRPTDATAAQQAATGDDAGAETPETALPALAKGDAVTVARAETLARKTSPPKRFTDGSLIEAMTGIARYVTNPQIRQILRETDGIGTEATRAETIEILFRRGFLEKKGRQVHSTETGRLLIATLPALATTPDMTAVWEAALRKIADGGMQLGEFLDRVLAQLRGVVETGKRTGPMAVPGARRCPKCEQGFLRDRTAKKSRRTFTGCNRYPDCDYIQRGAASVVEDEDDSEDEEEDDDAS
jgi:DNA topoisomerase-3